MTDMTASTDSSPLKGASSPRTRKVLVALGLLALAAFATVVTQSTQVQLTTSSNPAGIVSGSAYHDVGSTVSVPAAAVTSNSYRFAYWKLNGVRQVDALGISVNAFNFKILENSQVVAEYQLESADTDADQVPDWYEFRQYGDLNQSPGSDTDEDGVTLLQEYEKGSQPRIPDSAENGGIVDGGISRRRGEMLAVTVGAEYALYAESSTPPGVVSRKEYLKKGTQVSTANLGAEHLGHRFTQWIINGVRQETESGIARNQVSFVIAEDTQAVAEYLPKEQDSDADALPDWYEMNQYGTLEMGPDSDSDEDGRSLADEYASGTQPRIADGADDGAVVEGGVSRRRGEKLALAFDAAFVHYTESSVPGGAVSRDVHLSIGTSITTANAPLESNGYKFSQWLINGARQETDSGSAKSIVTFELKAETKAIAYYYAASQDADADQIPDWYEIQQYGDILQGPDSDTDEDGVDFLTEYQGGTQPRVSDSAGDGGIVEGGVSRRRAEKLVLNLQYFPAAQVADAQGGGIFSDPYNRAGGGFSIEGGSSAPALGDIDGDGDFDLLVGGADGAVRLLRNTGSAFAPSYDQLTGSDLSSLPNWPQGRVYPAFGDWNKDGRADLVVGSDDGVLRFYLNRSAVGLLFESAGTLPIGTAAVYPSFFKSADKLDLLVLDGLTGLVSLYGQVSDNPPFALPALSGDVLGTPVEKGSGLAVADVTGDGLLDILASDRDGRMWLFTGKNGGNFELTSKVWASTSNGFKQGLSGAVVDVNGDGDMDLIGGGNDGALVYLENPEKHLRVTPVVATVRSGETLNYSSVDDDQTLRWSMGRAQSGGLVDAITGVYTAGDKSGLDQIVVRNSAGRMGVAWVNVIKNGASNLKWNALLVDGRRSPNDPIWPAADALNVRAKEILLYRGLNHDQIHWLGHANEGPDGSPTKAALASALRDGTTLDQDTETFVVYMADHGRKATNGDGIFLLSENESVTGTELDSWLDDLQAARPNLSVLLVVESCYGGRVAGKLAEVDDYSPRRLVLSSSGADELSHLAANGLVSYSTMWWSALAAGKTIGEAHNDAAAAMDSLQTALASEGGSALWDSKLGLEEVSGTGRPVVVAKETSIDLDGSQETRIAVNVQSALGVNKVWGVVVPPGYSTRGNSPVLDLPEFEMEQDPASGEWSAVVGGFTEGGAPYTILLQARDAWGQVSPPVVIRVNQQDIRNRVIIFAHGEDGWDQADVAAELALYAKEVALLRRVNEDDIRMIMDPVFDANSALTCSVERLRTSITSWANADGKLGTLTIIAMGQASKLGLLCANGDTITSFALKPWLDTLQRQSGATVQLIVDSDYSGHFVVNAGSSIYRRIVISSTNKEDRNTFARGRWAGLTRSILNSIARGRDLRESYDEATALGDVSGNESPAELDDNGDGKYTKQRDGFKAVNAFIGSAYVTADDPPFIGRASAAMKVESGGEARFWVSDILMPDGEAPDAVWYEVRGPDGDAAGSGSLSLNATNQRYEGTFAQFVSNGTYTVYVQAGTQGNPSNTTPPAVIFADYIDAKDRGAPLAGEAPAMALPLDGQSMDVENEQGREWRVTLLRGQRVSIEAFSVLRDVTLELIGNNNVVLASSDEWGNGFGEKIESWEAPSDGVYVVRSSFAPGNGSASCKVRAYIRYEAESYDVVLSGLSIDGVNLNQAFASGVTSYTANVSNTTSSIRVRPAVSEANASVRVNGLLISNDGDVEVPLALGGNIIEVQITAAGGATSKYTVAVTRGANPNSSDSDEDGYSDDEEVERGSNPNDSGSYPEVYLSMSSNEGGRLDVAGLDYWLGGYGSYGENTRLRSTVTLTAVPDSGYVFSAWSGDDSSTTNPLELQMDVDKSVQANFEPDNADSDGDGLTNYAEVVTHLTNPNSSDSDEDGYSDGEEVERGSAPNDGSSKPQVNLSFSSGSGGQIDAAGIDSYDYWWVWNGSYNGYVDLRSTVTLTAVPESGYVFSAWSGDDSSTTNPLELQMDANKSVQATFEPDNADSDSDGLTNYAEVVTHLTNPNSSDSDEDGYSDGEEVERGSAPNDSGSYPEVYLSMSSNEGGRIDAAGLDDWLGWYGSYGENTRLRSRVTLTAVPDSGYIFSAWSGDNSSSTNPLDLEMDANKSVQATFEPDNADSDSDGLTNYAEVVTHLTNPNSSDSDEDGYSDGEEVERGSAPNDSGNYPEVYLSMSSNEGGRIDAVGLDDWLGWYGSYGENTRLRSKVTLTAVPESGYVFSAWSGDDSSTTNPLELQMDVDKSVQANFEPDNADSDSDGLTNYAEVVTHLTNPNSSDSDEDGYSDGEEVERGSGPNDNGSKPTVNLSFSNSGGGNINATGSDAYNWGWVWYDSYNVPLRSTATLTAVPDSGYVFSAWSGDDSSTTNPLELQMDTNKSVQATFEPDNADSDSDGLTNYAEVVNHLTNPNSSDSDEDGYSDGEEVERGSGPNNNWSKPQVYLSFSSNGGGRINATGIGSYNYWWGWHEDYNQDPYNGYVDLRSTVTLTATPDSGYLFSSWSGDATGASNSLSLTMDVDKSVQATFEPDYADSDGDGLTNYAEVVTHLTNPNSSDSDGDGYSDGEEVERGSDPNAYLSKPLASISGMVTDKSGVGLAGISVVAYHYYDNYGSWYASSSTTGENGSYQLHGLNAGTYRVEFRDYSGEYLSAWSTFITISESEEVGNINASLAKPSSISGAITDEVGIPLEGIEVSVYSINSDSDEQDLQWDWKSYATTDADGAYTVSGLPAGNYRLEFSSRWSGDFITEYYNNALSIDSAQDIVLSEAEDSVGIDASLTTSSRINGVVTDQDGSPLEEISVSVYRYDAKDEWWHRVTGTETDEFGEYSLGGLAAGNYRVAFRDYYGEYAVECYENATDLDSAKDIVLAESTDISGINASLVKASGISGVVTGPNGQTPLADVEVELERWTGNDWSWQDQTSTDGNGSYQFDGLPAGTYRIEFEDESGEYALEYYNNEVEFDLAEKIVLAPEQQVENINASLVPGSRINGKVTGPDGSPLAAVCVDVFRLQENGQWDWYEDTEANADGTYEIGGLPNGTYRVGFLDDDEVYAVQFYKNSGNTMYFELARKLVISSPQTISGVNAKFDKKAGSIEGKVTDSDGSTPLHEVRIEAYRKDDHGLWQLVLFGDLESDDDGFFDPSILPAGTYRFKFQKDGYLTKFYGDVYTIADAKDISLSDGQVVEGINVSLSTEPAPQSISAFASIGNKVYGDAPFAVTTPSSSSSLPVTLSVKSGPAMISGNTVTITGVGTVTLAANQAGNANYAAATEARTSFTVVKGTQTTAAFASIGNKDYVDAPFTVVAPNATSGLAVTLSVKSGPAMISGNAVTITGVGTVTLAANQAGNDNYTAATEMTTSFTVSKGAQSIGDFASIGNKTYGDAPFTVTAPTASSGLPVILSIKSGPATISGNTVTITGAGAVVLAANQAGNANYAAATEVTMSFTVSKAAQKIAAFGSIGDKTYGDVPFVVTAPSLESSLPVTLSVKSGPATISGNTVNITGAGTVVLAAKQAGDVNYAEATEVTTSFTVAKATQTIAAFADLETKTLGDASFAVAVPSATSGLPVTLSVKSGPATISGSTVTINATGIVMLAANQSGNANYLAADPVIAAFAVMDIKSMAGDFIGNYDFDGAAELQDAYDYNGQLSLKVTKGGAFSGSLVVRGSRVGIRGQFDENGFTELDVKTKTLSGISLELLIEPMNDKEYQVAASLVWPDQPSTPFNCYPVAYAGTGGEKNFPLGGKQINSLMVSQSTSGIDFGHGFAMIKASNDGTLKFTGRAADGSAIIGTTRLVRDAFGDILAPVSFPLSAVKGLLHGVAKIDANPEEGQYHLSSPSEWTWVRLPQAKAKTYKEGFAEKLGVYGQVWSFTKGQSALPEAAGGFTFQVDPDSVLLEGPLKLNGTWPTSNKPTWNVAPTKGFTFKVNTATGQISGAAPRTVNGKAAKALSYQGLLVKPGLDTFDGAPLLGGGYILGTESSGVVELTAP